MTYRRIIAKSILSALLPLVALNTMAQSLVEGFIVPPQEARPRVWWHWMNGNITKDGIRKDIEWMNRVGIGGFHCFEAGMSTPQVVDKRLPYMSEEWKDAFRYAVEMADSLGMEVATASCPGWSNTGGPWVKPDQAMKKLVWRVQDVKGGRRVTMKLPAPYKTAGSYQNVASGTNMSAYLEPADKDGWYRDLYFIAVRRAKADKTMQEMGAKVSASGVEVTLEQLTDGDISKSVKLPKDPKYGYAWIEFSFKKPQTIKALSIADGRQRSVWQAAPAPVGKYLEASNDGINYETVCYIPHGGTYLQTIEIPPTKGKYFRVVFDNPSNSSKASNPEFISLAELVLYTVSKINHSEEKTGFATPSDLMDNPTTGSDAVAEGDVIDLTDKVDADGNLTWNAPKGIWKIYRFGYSLTGRTNHPASPEATGLEVTKMDKDAFTGFLEYYLDMYKDATNGLMGERGLHYLLIDSYEAGCETWAPKLPQEFKKRRGYSLTHWLPVLTGEIVESAEKSEEFLYDWRTTIGELIVECMYENAAEIAKRHGMETYFESHENGRLYLADGMSVKSKADIPMAAMWTKVPGRNSDNSNSVMAESDIRESASVAHLYGRKYVAAESLTANGATGWAYGYYPGNLKTTADLEMANGVNRFVIHESAHQPTDDKKPGLGLGIYGQWFNRHETWSEQAKAWTDYLARSCYMLQQGQNVADILYYYGEDDAVTSIYGRRHPEIPFCHNYDYVNKEALLELISFDGQNYVTPTGGKYRLLVIGEKCQHISAEVSEKIEAMKKQGAVVCDRRSEPLAEALNTLQPDFTADDMSDMRFVHRKTAGTDIYWVNNRADKARMVRASFRISGKKPSLWHPETGKMEDVSYEINDGRTIVDMKLVENDAVFVVFEGIAIADKVSMPETKETMFRRIDTPWTVNFDEQWGGPKEVSFDKLASYTESSDEGIKYYSGTAVYQNQTTLTASDIKQGRYMLNLGKVGCLAEVFVNGRNLGVLWKSPYKVDITEAIKEGQNDIEIHVVNQWANRIIGDKQPECRKRYTYPANDGFYKADSELFPAGLMGPVDITLVQNIPLP